jgi:hypothetical protein
MASVAHWPRDARSNAFRDFACSSTAISHIQQIEDDQPQQAAGQKSEKCARHHCQQEALYIRNARTEQEICHDPPYYGRYASNRDA